MAQVFMTTWFLKKPSFLAPCLIDTSTFTTRNHNLFDQKNQ